MAKPVKNAKERLFTCVMSTGIFYSDKQTVEHGDFRKLAHLMFSDLGLDIRKNVAPEFVELIKADAKKIQARKGERYQISTSGQTITLGYKL